MTRFHRSIVTACAAGSLLGTITHAQAPNTAVIVEQFYPQTLTDLAVDSGEPDTREQCFSVWDTDGHGAPRTIIAAYTNRTTAAIRVLRAEGDGFIVAAEPQGLALFGFMCDVSLIDLDADGRNEVRVDFSARADTVSWLFTWDGQQLVNLAPTSLTPATGRQASNLVRASLVDVNNDGVKEIHVASEPSPGGTPSDADLIYRLQDGRFVEDMRVVGLWAFTRTTGTPETSLQTVVLPQGATGPYLLRVLNGLPDGQLRATSAEISLNAVEVVTPSDFAGEPALIDRAVTLAGENQLTVRFAGKPSSTITVLITSAGSNIP